MRAMIGLFLLGSAGWAAETASSSALANDIDSYLDSQSALSAAATFAEQDDYHAMFWGEDPDWFMATAGVWWGRLTGPVKFDGGTVLDVADVFGLGNRSVIPFVRLGFRLWRFEVILEGWWYASDGTATVDEEFEIDGVVFEVGEVIDSRITLNSYRLAIAFECWRSDPITVDIMLGLTVINTTGRVETTATGKSASWDENLPVPAIGLNLAGNPWKKLIYEFEVNWIGLSDSTFSVVSWDIRLSVGWQFNKWSFGRIGYRYMTLQGDIDAVGVELDLEGFYLEFGVTF